MSDSHQTADRAEVRTRSVPAAGYLLCAGFEPLRIIAQPDGTKVVVFAAAARPAFEKYLAAKSRIDTMLETTDLPKTPRER